MIETAEANKLVLTDSLSAELWNNGHVLVRQAATAANILEHRDAIGETVKRLSGKAIPLEDRSTYDKAFLQ